MSFGSLREACRRVASAHVFRKPRVLFFENERGLKPRDDKETHANPPKGGERERTITARKQ
jgi:hypothetical protein